MTELVRRSCVVIGRVQGVGFRAFTVARATSHQLSGMVQNGADGRSVEIVVEGAMEDMEPFLRDIELGPPGAHVEEIKVTELSGPRQFSGFVVRP